MRDNKLRELLNDEKATIGTHIHSTWPGIVEVIGHTNEIDYIEFTGEYAPYDLNDLEGMARASELTGMSSMIKIDQEPRTFLSQRAIGEGIQNILFADVRTAEEARECVQAVRAETPETNGTYGCSMRRLAGYLLECGTTSYVDYLDEVVVAIMIEKKSAMDNLQDILSVEGIDMVQFGPCDYAMSIGLTGQTDHPKVQKAEEKMIEVALEKGIAPRAEIGSFEQAERYLKLGVKDFCIGTDVVILHNWLKEHSSNLQNMISKDLSTRKNG